MDLEDIISEQYAKKGWALSNFKTASQRINAIKVIGNHWILLRKFKLNNIPEWGILSGKSDGPTTGSMWFDIGTDKFGLVLLDIIEESEKRGNIKMVTDILDHYMQRYNNVDINIDLLINIMWGGFGCGL